ncbi:unnamed protein product [Medioppia subpectinata]|uniref:Cytochrome c oxidase assembly protein COX11, mitochondrial n=1 Tax=Medioppia subpectinata TaxID=1979941 RepID=A0A7R9KSG5_9ACAR|nr:unnamed protein product [Medioppia subpectinata]CAG2109002.1 unnamed protein product [Medioppia subpectinata]
MPTQPEIRCYPGETVLAFFTAKNPLDRPVDGIATYSVQPYEAGSYLNKIQCFCFEEQRLNPNELVDLPVFFYIDPEYADDPRLENINDIVLSYTFFEAKKEGFKLPSFASSTATSSAAPPVPPPTPPLTPGGQQLAQQL